ncbi:hypothetical protein, partial [Azotobacter salinestris]|uniref:hypothetical protein n=1 Tax=Azotobacter salinestris TaxID=69964 RepID=UPI0032DF52CA
SRILNSLQYQPFRLKSLFLRSNSIPKQPLRSFATVAQQFGLLSQPEEADRGSAIDPQHRAAKKRSVQKH